MNRPSMSVLALCLLLCAAASAQTFTDGAGIRRFDFGRPDSPVFEGFTQATHETKYDAAKGFGWITDLKPVGEPGWNDVTEPIITSRVRQYPDDASRDHVYGFSGYDVVKEIPATFQVDLPNGDYVVYLSVGDSGVSRGTNPFHVDINGKRVAENVAPGSNTEMEFAATVADGKLTVTFTANPELSAERCRANRWTEHIFTLWTVDYLMIYPAADKAVVAKDRATFKTLKVANMTKRFIPQGRPQKFEVRDGCIVHDGKPMFFNHRHEWGFTQGPFHDFLQYFGFGNAVMSYRGTGLARQGVEFLTPRWTESGEFPGELFAQASAAYEKGLLCTAYGGVYTFLPGVVKDNPLYAPCINNKGAEVSYPNYNDPVYREYVRQVFVNLGHWTRMHPGIIASYPYEEMYYRVWDGTIMSYDATSIRKYRAFLKDKYGTIEALNAAWQSTYESFEQIDPPKQKEQSPHFANFQLHRAKSLVEGYCKPSYEAFKQADPGRLVIGEKPNGQYFFLNYSLCANGFNYTPWCDIAKGEGGLERNEAEIRWWGLPRANMNMSLPKCAFQDLNENQLDPWTKRTPGADDYVVMMGKLFKGMKSLYTESYDIGGGAYHLVHPTKQYREKPPETPVSREKLKFKDVPLADYVIEPQALEVARAFQFAYRTAPILMPAKVRRSEAAHICTEMTSLFGYTAAGGSNNYGIQGDYARVHHLMDQLHLPADVITEFGFEKELEGRKVVLAGLHATVTSKDMMKSLIRFVDRGGVLILSGEAFRYDYDTLWSGEHSPICAFNGLMRTDFAKIQSFESESPLVVSDASLVPGLEKGDVLLPGRKRSFITVPVTEGASIVATVDDKPVVIATEDGHVVYIGVDWFGSAYTSAVPEEKNFRELIASFVERSGAKPPVEITAGNAWSIRPGILEGDGYALVEISNTDGVDQIVEGRLDFLPAGRWDVIDVTGEIPILDKNERNEFHLLRDTESEGGLLGRLEPGKRSIDLGLVGPRRSRVLMIRPAYQDVWQMLPDYTITALCRFPVAIVLPDEPRESEKQSAETIRTLLTAWGTDVKIVSAKDVKTVGDSKPITWSGYLLETFDGKKLDVDRHLIVIGEASRNAVTKTLYDAGTFTMDKVILRTNDKLPGAGKGVIQLVESVNSLVYDWTDKSRDAIVITASDEAGMQKALERFTMVLGQ